MPPNKKTQRNVVKAWIVTCSDNLNMRACTKKEAAQRHVDFLNKEYSGHCKHKAIPCTITYQLPKITKRK